MNSTGAFLRDRTVLGQSLVCPVRVLWREYLTYCKDWGFDTDGAEDFVRRVTSEEDVRIRKGGCGRFRCCFDGIGVDAGSLNTDDRAA